MKTLYKKENDKIVIEIPFYSPRSNPWMEESPGDYPTLTGLIVRHYKDENHWEEYGFAYTIDMDYKDKDDQYTDIMFVYDGDEEDFKKLCIEWGIKLIELEV